MKLALLSDIHANIQALDACLAHARAQGAEQFALLGDFVGYGADPVAVVQRVQELAGQGALLVKGNHDAMAVHPPAESKTLGDSTARWTHAQLDASQLAFLGGLPLVVEHGSMALVHASLNEPALWRYVTDQRAAAASLDAITSPDVRQVFGGHVHEQTLYYRGADASLMKFAPTPGVAIPVPRHRHWLATLGSVGQPRDGNPQAMYALFDSGRLQLSFHRVSYDHQAAAAAIRQAGLPAYCADRLEAGR
ncbi:metallophosphoesterase family protein [Polaromonas sp.]|jgi:diadenosine tetraphosphatase ApaH/serine/threonine PP2A family protein phosphatase|uniref:metallophosphoesterase family protein n=1 Tax=Polaromonas sp. TaxID=1869339 RepID=UPI002C6B88AD|nr:metallophosphoesterase family protein [Polaromonas sp.]HQS31438.1 metallophosphoesterase family protein [Polaromonas sp.]HQS90772.1 metallophosphoesterase family protein [Polaromonas sp.]